MGIGLINLWCLDTSLTATTGLIAQPLLPSSIVRNRVLLSGHFSRPSFPNTVVRSTHEQEDPLLAIIEEHLPQNQVDEEEEEESPPPRIPTNQEAVEALQTLLQHQICQSGTQHY